MDYKEYMEYEKHLRYDEEKGVREMSDEIGQRVSWDYFDRFENIREPYWVHIGEGENLASQTVIAVSKLVYKWYNDGDVYDNTHYMTGWANDLSSYANWLARYCGVGDILDRIEECSSDAEYEGILKDLVDELFDADRLKSYAVIPKKGSIYECNGAYEFCHRCDEDEEDWDEDEDLCEEDEEE